MAEKINIKSFSLFIALYALTFILSQLIFNWLHIAFIYWMPTAIAIGFTLVYGRKMLLVLLTLIIILIVAYLFNSRINIRAYLTFIFADLTACTLYSLYYKKYIPFLNFLDDLKKFILISIPIIVIQALIIASSHVLFNNTSEYSSIKLFELIVTGLSVSIFGLTPFVITNLTANTIKEEKFPIVELTILFLLSILPNLLNTSSLATTLNLLSIQLLLLVLFVLNAAKSKLQLSSIFIFIFTYSLVLNSALNRSFLSLYSTPNHVVNAQYLSIFISLLILSVGAILNERRNALDSLKNSYTDIQNEVNRQINIYRELNQKLIYEVEQRGIIERELNFSKKLLSESQEIANITSWEYDLKSKTIRWSESASRILGISTSQVSAFSMEKYIEKIHPDNKKAFIHIIDQASESTIDINIEIQYLLNKNYRQFLIRGRSFEENNEIQRIVGVLSDITEWKETQLALSEKETRYRALFDTNIDPVILIDGESKAIIDANVAFEKLYGYVKNEVIGKNYTILSAQEYETHQSLDIAVQKGFYRVPSRTHLKKSGEEFFVEGNFVKFISNEKPLLFAVLHDITSRKNFEIKLSERELKFRLFFESNLIGMAETTIYKTWITYNNKLIQILGYTPEELEKLTWDKITHADDLEIELKLFNNILQRKTDSYTLEKRFIKKDGSLVHCNVAVKAIKDNHGAITHLVKLIEDITPRKKAEFELIESQKKLKKAQKIAHLGVCRWNVQSGYLDLSEEAYTILKWEKGKVSLKFDDLFAIIHASDKNEFIQIIEKLIHGELNEENLEVRVINNSRDIIYLLLNLGVSHGANSIVSEIIITFADITPIKVAEISLKEANAMKDQLFSVIAHDLRGPIGSIEQMLSLYIENYETLDKGSQNELIDLLHKTAQESYNLLENLLEWGRSQRQSYAKPDIVEILPIVKESNSLLAGMLSSKNLSIQLQIDSDCRAFVDPDMLKTIFRNLLSNAIKFTPNGGKIFVKAYSDIHNCIISVTDTGIGIPESKIDLLFSDNEVFSTLGTNDEKGTGLGLKLVKRFVEKNGGSIRVESIENKGTTFIITLPLAKKS